MRPQAIFASVLALTMSAGALSTFAADQNPDLQGMVKVEGSVVTLAYQRPGTHWVRYKSVQIRPLDIRIPVRDPASVQQMFFDEMSTTLAAKNFVTVNTPRADTLIVQARLYQVVAGSLSIKMALSDGSTGTIVGAMSDLQSAKGLIKTRDDAVAEVRGAFHNWGRLVAAQLKAMADAADVDPDECFRWGKDCH